MQEYKIIDTTRIYADFSLRKNVDSLLNWRKIVDYNRLYLPDKSVFTKLRHANNMLSSIKHKDSTGKSPFSIRYYETGEIEGTGVFDVNTKERTYTGYYKNGALKEKSSGIPTRPALPFFKIQMDC